MLVLVNARRLAGALAVLLAMLLVQAGVAEAATTVWCRSARAELVHRLDTKPFYPRSGESSRITIRPSERPPEGWLANVSLVEVVNGSPKWEVPAGRCNVQIGCTRAVGPLHAGTYFWRIEAPYEYGGYPLDYRGTIEVCTYRK